MYKLASNILLTCFLVSIRLFSSAQAIVPNDTSATGERLYYFEGKASYYKSSFEGRRTANGERYHKNLLTAAHLKLPFNTLVKVTCKHNGRWVIVRINDRGPYSHKFSIDLSYRAAAHLGVTNKRGCDKVVIEEIKDTTKLKQVHVPEIVGIGLR